MAPRFDLMFNIQQCGLARHHFDKLLNDPRLVLWVTAQQTYISHPKILTLPLGVFKPSRMKAAMTERTSVRRATFVGNTVVSKHLVRRKINKFVSSHLPHQFFTRIPNVRWNAPNLGKWYEPVAALYAFLSLHACMSSQAHILELHLELKVYLEPCRVSTSY